MFKSKPFIFILPAFMLGIFVGKVFLVPWKVSMAFALICSFLFVIFYIKNILNFKKELVLVILTFFSLGALLIYPSLNPKIKENNIVNFVTKGKTFLKVKGVINSVIKRSDVSETFIVDVTGVLKDDQWQTSSGKVRIKLKGKTNYKRNDNIAFYGSFSRPQNFGNVDEFDYSLWLKFQEVLVTAYIDTDDKIILVKEGKGFNHYIDEKRNDLSLYIEGKEFKNKNIIKALITGERGYFSNDEYLVFQKTGTSHLLAVSGLHIGLVSIFSFMILMNIFKRFPALMLNYNVRKLSIFLSLVPAFLYATLAGLPVTAMRAFLMIALTVFILLIERPKNKFNRKSVV